MNSEKKDIPCAANMKVYSRNMECHYVRVKEDVQSITERGLRVMPSLGNRILKYLIDTRELLNMEDVKFTLSIGWFNSNEEHNRPSSKSYQSDLGEGTLPTSICIMYILTWRGARQTQLVKPPIWPWRGCPTTDTMLFRDEWALFPTQLEELKRDLRPSPRSSSDLA